MIDSLFWGAATALSLGTSDFLARFTSQRLGAVLSFAYTVITGVVLLALFVVVAGVEIRFTPLGATLAVLHGVFVTAMTIMLYAALARGPIGLVVPLVAAHPVFIILYELALGVSPLSPQQIAAALVIVLGVAGASALGVMGEGSRAEAGSRGGGGANRTLLLAGGASLAYALLIISGQAAAAEIGQISATLIGRLTSVCIILLAAAAGLFRFRRPGKSALPLLFQGGLDTLGYLALLAGGVTAYPSITAVVGSSFGFLTILLAWLIIRERLGGLQWFAIVISFAGIAWLASGH